MATAPQDTSFLAVPEVYGENPQAMNLDQILGSIQAQYTPTNTQNLGGQSYGAGRFISGTNFPSQGGFGNVIPSWYTPGEFDINVLSNPLPEEVKQQISEGTLYGGSSNVAGGGDSSGYGDLFASNPYAGMVVDPMAGLIEKLLPFPMSSVVGAARGYNAAVGSNAMNTGLAAYGGVTGDNTSLLGASLLGAIGITPDMVETNQALLAQYNNQPENLYGYMAAAVDPTVSQIADAIMANATQNMTPNEVGMLGNSIGEAINAQVADGKSLSEAVSTVATGFGVSPSDAAAMGINAAVAAVQNAQQAGIPIENIDPAALAISQDPMGALIDALGITGKISEQITAATTPLNEQIAALESSIAASDKAFQEAISGLDFATQQDVLNALANSGYATASDIQSLIDTISAPDTGVVVTPVPEPAPIIPTPLPPATGSSGGGSSTSSSSGGSAVVVTPVYTPPPVVATPLPPVYSGGSSSSSYSGGSFGGYGGVGGSGVSPGGGNAAGGYGYGGW